MLISDLLGVSLQARLENLFLRLGSDWVTMLLGGIAAFIILLFFERFVYFWWSHDNIESLRKRLGDALDRHQLGRARELLRKGRSHAARIAQSGLASLNRGPAAIEEVIATERILQQVKLERGLAMLQLLGNSAWAVGLFGLVVGLARAFADGNAMALAGAARALLVLAAGLAVAFPTLVAAHYVERLIHTRLMRADALVRVLLAYAKTRR